MLNENYQRDKETDEIIRVSNKMNLVTKQSFQINGWSSFCSFTQCGTVGITNGNVNWYRSTGQNCHFQDELSGFDSLPSATTYFWQPVGGNGPRPEKCMHSCINKKEVKNKTKFEKKNITSVSLVDFIVCTAKQRHLLTALFYAEDT